VRWQIILTLLICPISTSFRLLQLETLVVVISTITPPVTASAFTIDIIIIIDAAKDRKATCVLITGRHPEMETLKKQVMSLIEHRDRPHLAPFPHMMDYVEVPEMRP
jgi:hypothetical protein